MNNVHKHVGLAILFFIKFICYFSESQPAVAQQAKQSEGAVGNFIPGLDLISDSPADTSTLFNRSYQSLDPYGNRSREPVPPVSSVTQDRGSARYDREGGVGGVIPGLDMISQSPAEDSTLFNRTYQSSDPYGNRGREPVSSGTQDRGSSRYDMDPVSQGSSSAHESGSSRYGRNPSPVSSSGRGSSRYDRDPVPPVSSSTYDKGSSRYDRDPVPPVSSSTYDKGSSRYDRDPVPPVSSSTYDKGSSRYDRDPVPPVSSSAQSSRGSSRYDRDPVPPVSSSAQSSQWSSRYDRDPSPVSSSAHSRGSSSRYDRDPESLPSSSATSNRASSANSKDIPDPKKAEADLSIMDMDISPPPKYATQHEELMRQWKELKLKQELQKSQQKLESEKTRLVAALKARESEEKHRLHAEQLVREKARREEERRQQSNQAQQKVLLSQLQKDAQQREKQMKQKLDKEKGTLLTFLSSKAIKLSYKIQVSQSKENFPDLNDQLFYD